jgi:hypothetical protein
MRTRTRLAEGKYLPCEGGTIPPLVLGNACRMTQLAQNVIQESVNLWPAESSEFRPIPLGTKRYARTTPVLRRRTYELKLLIRTGLGC